MPKSWACERYTWVSPTAIVPNGTVYPKTLADTPQAIITLHILLVITDGLPLLPTAFSILCHLVYLSNFSSTWPFISLISPRFILSCILVVADHFTWFFHFAAKAQEAKRYRGPKYRYGSGQGKDDAPAFMDVAAFFAVCVWFVPLFLFLSLSANDNALPSFGQSDSWYSDCAEAEISLGPDAGSATPGAIDLHTPADGDPPSHRQVRARTSTSLVKSLLIPLISLLPRIRNRRRQNDEGIIAPRTPVRGSPLPSPVNLPQTSYFPRGDDTASSSNPSSYSSILTPDSAGGRMPRKSPLPPRRVQSEMNTTQGTINPRGMATRDGRPVVTDAQLTGEPEAMGDGIGVSSGMQLASCGPGGPAISLGPRGTDILGGAEVIESQLRSRRKAD